MHSLATATRNCISITVKIIIAKVTTELEGMLRLRTSSNSRRKGVASRLVLFFGSDSAFSRDQSSPQDTDASSPHWVGSLLPCDTADPDDMRDPLRPLDKPAQSCLKVLG